MEQQAQQYLCTCAVRACDCVRVLFMVFVPINLNLRNRANLTFSDIIIFRYHFPQIYKRGLISQYPPIKNNSTFKTFNSNTQIKNMIRSPFALFLTIVSIQQAVLGSMLTVRFRREADKDEIITISEAGK